MARDRQHAKRRREQRRQERLSQAGGDGAAAPAEPPGPHPAAGADGPGPAEAPAPLDNPELDAVERSELAASAPPEETGRSDTVLDPPAHPGASEPTPRRDDAEPPGDPAAGRGGAEAAPETHDRDRGRVLAFLAAVVAELKRVQWPDRAALTTLTGVVLGFVVIAGAYLGVLDAIFSRLVQALL